MNSEVSAEIKIHVLMTKYSVLRQETITYITTYKAHVKYFQVFVGAIIAFIGISDKLAIGGIWNGQMFWIGAMVFTTTVVSYLVFDVIESIYSMMAVSVRLALLEEMINVLANERLLAWESSLSRYFHTKFLPAKGVLQPNYFLSFYEFILVLIALSAVPIFVYCRFWHNSMEQHQLFRMLFVGGCIYTFVSLMLMAYSALCAALLIRGRASDIARRLIGRSKVQYLD
jgi:hypothetical protein